MNSQETNASIQAHSPQLGKIQSTRGLIGQSWKILKGNKTLVLLALANIGTIFICLLVFVSVFYLISPQLMKAVSDGVVSMKTVPMVFIGYLIFFFTTSYFTTAMFTSIRGYIEGKSMSFKEALDGAHIHIEKVLLWSILLALFQEIFSLLVTLGTPMFMVTILLGLVYSLSTLFGLISITVGNKTIPQSFKDSWFVIGRTWVQILLVTLIYMIFVIGITLFIGIFLAIVFILLKLTIPVFFTIVIPVISILYLICVVPYFYVFISVLEYVIYEFAHTGKIPQLPVIEKKP